MLAPAVLVVDPTIAETAHARAAPVVVVIIAGKSDISSKCG